MKKPPVSVTDKEIIVALESCHGNYRMAANKLRISYGTILCRARRNPEIEQTKLDACADMVAMAEDNVYSELLDGNFAASKFVLERLAREKWGNTQVQQVGGVWPSPIGN